MRLQAQIPKPGEQDRETRPTVGLLLFPGNREKLPGDEKMPPSGKVHPPVMSTVFFKPKFVTCGLRRRREYNR